ncbi:MAG: GNAT family N-acetyltransferase [Bacteroidales bacterium]|nr:GNAT family N-acetyltransferase [Bacteroidales bacterium]MCF8327372.1 GNAT family N-acetyltransferase [Bacteroidales bacterium]
MLNHLDILHADKSYLNTIVEFQKQMAYETEGIVLEEQTVYSGVKHIFDHPQTGHYLIAKHKDEIIANLLVLFEWSDWRNGDVLWIHSVFVKPEYRGMGVFKSMYQHVKKEVEERKDYKGIRLYVEKQNQKAQKVYKAVGMSNEHYELFEWLKDE